MTVIKNKSGKLEVIFKNQQGYLRNRHTSELQQGTSLLALLAGMSENFNSMVLILGKMDRNQDFEGCLETRNLRSFFKTMKLFYNSVNNFVAILSDSGKFLRFLHPVILNFNLAK